MSDCATKAGPFDYDTEAELFSAVKQKFRRSPLAYKRFAHAADAIRFAIEELPSLIGTFLEVASQIPGNDIRRLYEASTIRLFGVRVRVLAFSLSVPRGESRGNRHLPTRAADVTSSEVT